MRQPLQRGRDAGSGAVEQRGVESFVACAGQSPEYRVSEHTLVAGCDDKCRGIGDDAFEREIGTLPQPARCGMAVKSGVRHKLGDEAVGTRDDTAFLPEQCRDRRRIRGAGGPCLVYASDERFSAVRLSGERRELAHLRFAIGDSGGDTEGFDADTQPLECIARGRREEAAGDHHVRIEREHFLHRAARYWVLMSEVLRHRTGGGIVAIVRDRQQLLRADQQ